MKRKILAMTLLLAIVASMLVFAACKDDEPDEPKKLLERLFHTKPTYQLCV